MKDTRGQVPNKEGLWFHDIKGLSDCLLGGLSPHAKLLASATPRPWAEVAEVTSMAHR